MKLLIGILLLSIFVISCTPSSCPEVRINSTYKEDNGTFTYFVTVPTCENENSTMCAGYDENLDRCVLVVK
jgi:hypothetical protein